MLLSLQFSNNILAEIWGILFIIESLELPAINLHDLNMDAFPRIDDTLATGKTRRRN